MASFEGATVAAILLTLIWFPLQVLEYNCVPLVGYSIMITMAAMFLWHKGAELMNRFSPPCATDLRLPESTCRYLFEQTNLFLGKFFEISSGKDLKLLVVAMAGLYMLSAIGNYFSPLTLLYICILFIATVPALYAEYGAPVYALVAPGIQEARILYQKFQINFLDKIPRGLMKARIH